MKILNQAKVIALQVPSDVTGIENFEQIFQRLNRQGTPLDNEELVYSMIKAYWPEVEKIIQGFDRQVTTEARLIGMAVRVALIEKNANKIATERSVAQIREIFKPDKSGARPAVALVVKHETLDEWSPYDSVDSASRRTSPCQLGRSAGPDGGWISADPGPGRARGLWHV